MRKLFAWILTFLLCAPLGWAQGLTPPAGQTEKSWEEINFRFGSAELTDGYPGLLDFAQRLKQQSGFHVVAEGHCDSVGTVEYNNKLSLDRANSVRDFLIKYGAHPEQVKAVGFGKKSPEVSNDTAGGRWINRRVTLTLFDAQGKVVSEGGVGDAIRGIESCCKDIMKRLEKLDKLDEIIALLKERKEEISKLEQNLAEIRQQVVEAPKPQIAPVPTASEIAKAIAMQRSPEEVATAGKRNHGWFGNFVRELIPDARDVKTFAISYGASWLANRPLMDYNRRILSGQTTGFNAVLVGQSALGQRMDASFNSVLSGQTTGFTSVLAGQSALGQRMDASFNSVLSGQGSLSRQMSDGLAEGRKLAERIQAGVDANGKAIGGVNTLLLPPCKFSDPFGGVHYNPPPCR